ncbi:hypothetical protein F4778DRAFT_773095 [Xylariomycetidae sp. FL2044]|nr:hypothetical protein F4778DRAFT_773095 [Xylariomycetidae sp. FL2044]
MFGGLSNITFSTIGPRPKDVPPPTPVVLPECSPRLPGSSDTTSGPAGTTSHGTQPSLVRFLQTLHRPTELDDSHFAALGVHVHPDTPAEGIVPDSRYLPSASDWNDVVNLDQARSKDSTFRHPLSNGQLSPEARVYLERRNELSVQNQAAFRTVRRIQPEPGKQAPRLGNCYEFFKQMELVAAYWDDTSLPPLPEDEDSDTEEEAAPTLPPRSHPHPHPIDASLEQAGHSIIAAASESNARSEKLTKKPKDHERVTYRTSPGTLMPPEHRHNMVAAFIKLVAYDFGCNVVPPRVEPRLHLVEPPLPKEIQKSKQQAYTPRASYISSGCVFVCRAPRTREAARSGIVEGPVAAVSARNTTNFSTPIDSKVDFGREIVAALLTAQLRARQGKAEKRFGEGKWWATAKRWGGGEGGPIGREVEGDTSVGDADAPSPSTSPATAEARPTPDEDSKVPRLPAAQKPGLGSLPVRGQPLAKRPRKTMSVYDNYRMIRLPSSNWDKKMRYEAIGRVKGQDYDDVFVLSSLFHHFSVLRFRVPDQLLNVFDGAPEDEGSTERSWGKLEVWRSKWFDLLVVEERLEALRLLWGFCGWSMRKGDDEAREGGVENKGKGEGDVVMKGS